MKKLLSLLTFAGMLFVVSCSEDEPVAVAPSVTAPPASTVTSGTETTLSFDFTTAGGYASATVEVSGGTETNTVNATAGDTSGSVDVTFTAGEAGAGSVTVTVTDANGNTGNATAVITISAIPVTEIVVVSGFVQGNVTWTADKIYELAGRVVVDADAVLTIEAGTIIKGREGEGSAASALVVARDGQLMAMGTAEAPIIMTSVSDDIDVNDPKNAFGTGVDETSNGLWGGLIILGNAPISADAESEQIEGIPADFTYGLYGGTASDDNSGTIQYVSVRHGGITIGEGNEINGITFGGVGSGTIVNHIEVVANADDGIEMFGGSVNISNVVIWAADDDAIDIDQAYSGTVDNAVVVAFNGTDHGLEIDGPEGTLEGSFTVTNLTVKGFNDELGQYRDGATGTTSNAYFFGFQTIADGEGDLSYDDKTDGTGLSFSNLEVTLAADATALSDMLKETAMQDAGTAVAEGANTVGADTSVFGWTLTAGAGALDF